MIDELTQGSIGMGALALTFLGPFQAARDGVPLSHFRSDKVRALLAFLATEADRAHTRSSLAALFWPNQPDEAALRNLSQTLVRLRETIGTSADTLLLITRQTMQWKRSGSYSLDVAAFTRLAQSAGTEDLEQATALYRGEFLAGFALPGCVAFEEWLQLTREQLHQQAMTVLHTLTAHHLLEGRYDDTIRTARRQIALDPWRETAYRQLMQALVGKGERSAALAAYAQCRRVLQEELGIEPAPATTALYEQIKTRREDTALAPVPAQAALPKPGGSIPAPLTPLLGREEELARLEALLRSSTVRLVTLLGAGGAGKTRLALAAAWALRGDFADGVWWVPLSGIPATADEAFQRDALAAALAAVLGWAFTGQRDAVAELCSSLRDNDVLLVLDNCEHLSGVAAFVHELLEAAPRVRVLATSRTRLGLPGEEPLRLDGLPVPAVAADDAAAYASVQLFLTRAARQVRDFGKDAATLAAVVRLCRLLDGLPLGIELAAHWVGHYSCDEIAAAIQSDLAFLAVQGGGYPERQRSLQAAIAYSWRLLSESEQLALAKLAVFRSTFDRAAAQAVAEVSVTTLATLVDTSLLRQAGIGRYALHELLRQFAATQLTAMGADAATQERHASYYLDLLEQQVEVLSGGVPQAALATIGDALDNVRQAWTWASEHAHVAIIGHGLTGLALYYSLSGLFHEAQVRFLTTAERIQAAAQDSGGLSVEQHEVVGWLLGLAAHFLERQEQREQAAASARSAITHAQAAGDVLGEAYGYVQLSRATIHHLAALRMITDDTEVERWLERALALCRAAPRTSLRQRQYVGSVEMETFLCLGTLRITQERYVRAELACEQALQIARAIGSRSGEFMALNTYAEALEQAARYEQARALREETLHIAREIRSKANESIALNNLSGVLVYLGEYAAARDYARQAVQICQALGLETWAFRHTESRAACRQEDYAAALVAARQAVEAAHQTDFALNALFPLLALGDALFGLQRYHDARTAYAEATSLGPANRPASFVARVGVANCLLALGKPQDALVELATSITLTAWRTLDSVFEPLRVALTCYRILKANDDPRSGALLHQAHTLIQEQAALIADPERRRVFLHAIAAHREILAEHARLAQEAAPPAVDTQAVPAASSQPTTGAATPTDPALFSERELQVLRLVAAGHSDKQIADHLFLAVGTIKRHLNRIYDKFGVHSRTQALARARDLGLI